MDIKQEDLIRFWTWFDIKWINNGYVEGWKFPNGVFCESNCPPDIDLNFLYQYAIPKLQDKGYMVDLRAYEYKGFSARLTDIIHDDKPMIQWESDNPTEALYKAIMEVINAEG